MNADTPWIDYDDALVRVVPRVHLEVFVNVGVVAHARATGFLAARLYPDRMRVAALCPPPLDLDRLARHLTAYGQVCRGGPDAGPLGLLPPSERFHWLTAPRSAVVQTCPVHAGRTRDPATTLATLFAACVSHASFS